MCVFQLKKFSGAEVCGNHLKSSNLGHFAGCIHAAYNAPGVVQILSPFAMDGRSENLVVDVVANQGQTWVKVIARKAQALHLIWAGMFKDNHVFIYLHVKNAEFPPEFLFFTVLHQEKFTN